MFAHKGIDGLVESLQEFKRFNLIAMSILTKNLVTLIEGP
jgi:hypothetical protein